MQFPILFGCFGAWNWTMTLRSHCTGRIFNRLKILERSRVNDVSRQIFQPVEKFDRWRMKVAWFERPHQPLYPPEDKIRCIYNNRVILTLQSELICEGSSAPKWSVRVRDHFVGYWRLHVSSAKTQTLKMWKRFKNLIICFLFLMV